MSRLLTWTLIVATVVPMPAVQEPSAEPAEFYFTRLIFPSRNDRGMIRQCWEGGTRGGPDWATDCPEADYKFMWGVQRMTNIRVFPDVNAVAVMDPQLFDYPYLYIVDPGWMNLTPAQAVQLREYLERGGFLHIDDFWGLPQLANVQREMAKVFPERQMVEMPMSHEIFHSFFDVDTVMQIPNYRLGCYGGRTWEHPSDTRPRIFGISDERDRLQVILTYNSDLGDAWEHMDLPCYPELYSGQAYRMGMNFIVYAMSH